MVYFGTRLSDNLSRREPEGYLICLNVPVARSGTQEYLPEELGLEPGGPPVPVFRPEEEVFSPACLASFEGMPVTNDHPSFPEGVTAENSRWLQKGHAHNVRRGAGPESDLLLADLMITDPALAEEILGGKREISCGYNYTLCEENGRFVQRDIRGNHIAVVDAGRAGPRVSIRDHKKPVRQPIQSRQSNEGSIKPMKQSDRAGKLYARRTARLMARMARDGETEELAEMIAELVEPEAADIPVTDPAAEVVGTVEEILSGEETPEPVAVTVPENREISIDEEEAGPAQGMEQILSLLRQILSALQPAADCGSPSRDEDPAEESTEAQADPVEALVEEVISETVQEDPAVLVGEALEAVLSDPETGDENVFSAVLSPEEEPADDRAADALRAAMSAFRPVLKTMAPAARRRVVQKIASDLRTQNRLRSGGASDTLALLKGASGRAPVAGTDLGRRIMEKRNANLRKNA